ncbi:GAPVD1 [Cordylochernes scorpioides]|uniref:GAPVD1 n=1 Tax=Cordylochernes scorpioides TaxID=51811 RepID=A0ABY6K6N2_9ARAC|nr:GAPVD1 [Cordylochernes scorpioides]
MVQQAAEQLFHQSWISKQQHISLERLILSQLEASPATTLTLFNSYEASRFVDGYKVLGGQEPSYSMLLGLLRSNPRLVALCLASPGDKVTLEHMVNVFMASIYGNCLLPEDEGHVLTLLKELMVLQLTTTANPLRLLRHGSCAFSRVYKALNEGLFAAKLYLTAALHDPIMRLLMEDDLFLDIDSSKSAVRFPQKERLRHFGREGTPEYEEKVRKYRNTIISKLVALTNRFIAGIRNHMFCFPQSLAWLVRNLAETMAGHAEPREVWAMCADLVFAFFICPAVVNPEPYGIMEDVHISNIARFNLMQVAQILQVFAMAKWEDLDPRLMDIYSKFDKDCMSSVLDQILAGEVMEVGSQIPPDLKRSAVLITKSDLQALVAYLRGLQGVVPDLQASLSSLKSLNGTGSGGLTGEDGGEDVVLVVPLSVGGGGDCPGMLTEDKVLMQHKSRVRMVGTPPAEGKRTRFSQDYQESLVIVAVYACGVDVEKGPIRQQLWNAPKCDNVESWFGAQSRMIPAGTSDNLEALSEAASNHSVSSSLDLENDDNLSDMVSANVSGRGTPNVSGRDTPSSQLEGGEDPPLAQPAKQNAGDIEEKFGRFEIKPLVEADETKSMVSDTWSTDVLASDSETVEQSEQPPQPPIMPPELQPPQDGGTSETASDAWSTDVMTSDTERLQELDTDDNASVTRSDDLINFGTPEVKAIDLFLASTYLDLCGPRANHTPSQEDLTPTGNNSDSSALVEDNFNNMQSLGRLSLAVKEEPEENLISTIQDNMPTPKSRSSLADILSMDLTQTLNLPPSPAPTSSGLADFQNNLESGAPRSSSTPKEGEDGKPHNRKSFFKLSNFKLTFKVKPKKHHHHSGAGNHGSGDDSGPSLKVQQPLESSEDILAKYRTKKPDQPSPAGPPAECIEEDEGPPQTEAEIMEDAKRKLRMVLSRTDVDLLPSLSGMSTMEVDTLLRLLLAEATNLQNRALMAQLHEALRCLDSLDSMRCQKLVASLIADYKGRAPYIAYLTRSAQSLLASSAYLDSLLSRTERDKLSCSKHLLSYCVRSFLESKERMVQRFVTNFQSLNVADEKALLVEKFLEYLYSSMEADPIWQQATEQQLEFSQTVIQRAVMGQIYLYALYPNGDGDVLRDRVLHEHMSKLAGVFQRECPWPSAQAELITITAFKTPQDKLHCVLNCMSILVNLLQMANVIPAADDLLPVLVYVLIQANPPALLSTIQYIDTFLRLEGGEEAYWWTQFRSAAEFIKNLDYA